MTTSRPPLSAYAISPINPSSTTDIAQVVAMLNATFDGETSRFQRAYYVEPYPFKEKRETSYSRRLIDGLTNKGKKGWQVKLEDEVVGVMIWQPPGVGYHLFDTETKTKTNESTPSGSASISDQTGPGELYEYIDPAGWNSLYGKMQAARNKVHEGRPGCWYLELLAIHPSYQARGLGAHLLMHLLSSLPPTTSAHLESSPEGLRLYEKLGFEVVDRLETQGRDGGLIEAPVLVRWGKESGGEKTVS